VGTAAQRAFGSAADKGPAVTVDSRDASSPAPELSHLLLDAKFSVPQPRPDTVSRGGLVQTARSSDSRLVAVTAPAGYGKSTFLAEWAAREDRRVAWVTLDRFDDDPATLLASLASAYYRAGLGSPDLALDTRGQGMSVLGRAAPRLAAEFRASLVPFVLMLDDLHELRSWPSPSRPRQDRRAAGSLQPHGQDRGQGDLSQAGRLIPERRGATSDRDRPARRLADVTAGVGAPSEPPLRARAAEWTGSGPQSDHPLPISG